MALAKNGQIVVGDTRIQAAVELGMAHVPVRFIGLNAKEAKAYAVADNATGEIADWDGGLLREVLEGISGEFEPIELGFTDSGLMKHLAYEPIETAGAEGAPIPPGAPNVEGLPSGLTPTSIRMVQLMLSNEEHARVEKAVRALAEKMGTKTVSDTVRDVVLEAAEKLQK